MTWATKNMIWLHWYTRSDEAAGPGRKQNIKTELPMDGIVQRTVVHNASSNTCQSTEVFGRCADRVNFG